VGSTGRRGGGAISEYVLYTLPIVGMDGGGEGKGEECRLMCDGQAHDRDAEYDCLGLYEYSVYASLPSFYDYDRTTHPLPRRLPSRRLP